MNTTRKIGIACIVVTVYLLTATFSNGYHHPDEHFQLIEFAGLKLGWNSASDLPWEYESRIRPALQPAIAYAVIGTLRLTGVESPYVQALALRLLSMGLAFCCIGGFIRSFARTVNERHRMAYTLLSFLIWFLPAINVRFSSESWAGLLLLAGLAVLYRQGKQSAGTALAAGALLGLSFECRYQMALAIAGLMGWLWWSKRWQWKEWMAFVGGGMGVLAICAMIDCWFYGVPVFPPYHYFRVNICEDVASMFGTFPWYFYPVQMMVRPTWVIGFCLFFSLGCALFHKKEHPVLWCIVPFIVVHCLIPHKELRFLFPMANFVPLLLVWGYEWGVNRMNRHVYRLLFVIVMIINAGGLLMMAGKPAGIGNANMMQHVTHHYADRDFTFYATPLGNPCLESSFLPVRFYADSRINWKDYVEEVEKASMFQTVELNRCVVVLMQVEKERANYLLRHGFAEKYRSIPLWVERLNRFYGVYRQERTLVLYEKDEVLP